MEGNLAHIKKSVETNLSYRWYFAKMGTDELAVVKIASSHESKLRIADASIMPTIVSGNTNAACIMIGRKGSGFNSQMRKNIAI